MFKIKNSAFYVTRGDEGSFEIGFENYTFKASDQLEFKVYRENGFDETPVLYKTYTIGNHPGSTGAATVTMVLLADDTTFEEQPENEVVEYWYEIKLNGNQTVYCYDESGPKLFYLYPGGFDDGVGSEST